MLKGGQSVAAKHTEGHVNFIRNSLEEDLPPNTIIVLDTHSDSFNGQLQTTGGLTGVGTTLTLPDLLRSYVGDEALNEMRRASEVARQYNIVPRISPELTPWADITPKARGGWRVMVMVSCGSAVRTPIHWEYINQLFTQ